MPATVGKGGQSQNQNQYQAGSYNNVGNTLSSTTGTTTGTNTGTTTGTTSGTTMAVAPAGYESAWNSFRPGAGGFNPTQQGAVDWLSGQLGAGDPAGLSQQRGNIDRAGAFQWDTLATRTAPTLRNMAAIDPAAYGAPSAVTSQDVTARQIAAQRGADFMGAYKNPFLNDVVNSSLAGYDQSVEEQRAALKGRNAGAFGNNRLGVAEGQFAADSALGRGQLQSGLLSQGFNTAAGLGQQDAGRFLTAEQSNQMAQLQAEQFNSGETTRRQMFDSQTEMAYNASRDQLARDYVNTQNANAGLGSQAFDISRGLAQGLFGAGGQGISQNLSWLNAGNPLIGQSNNATSNMTNTGTTTSNVDQTTAGSSSDVGSTSGNSVGNSRGKSGGLSLSGG